MADTPRPPRRDSKPDNVVKFNRKKPAPAAGAPLPNVAGLRRAIAGREGLVGLVLIVLVATLLVLWKRLAG